MSAYTPTFSTVEQARMLDVADVIKLEHDIADAGTPLAELMQRAGLAVALFAQPLLADANSVLILCGSGNNGGDGWVAAELLADMGARVTLVTPVSAEEITAQPARDAAVAAQASRTFDVRIAPSAEDLASVLAQTDIVIDALLGTGFSGTSLRGYTLEWVTALATEQQRRAANGTPLPVIAVDAPSGVNAQTGAACNPSVQAVATVTMMAAKPGLTVEPGSTYAGKVVVASIYPIDELLQPSIIDETGRAI